MHNHGMIKDGLDDLIEAKRRECEALRARLAALEVELRAFERAAELRPNETAGRHSVRMTEDHGLERRAHSRKGRQPGAISKNWRKILSSVAAHYPDGASPEDIASYGAALGLPNLRPTDARQQAEKYVAYGYIERVGDRYKVTDMARERFRTVEPPTEERESLSEGNKENIYAAAA
jgi:hypothetical protein